MFFEISLTLWAIIILFWIGWKIAQITLYFERLERKIDKLSSGRN